MPSFDMPSTDEDFSHVHVDPRWLTPVFVGVDLNALLQQIRHNPAGMRRCSLEADSEYTGLCSSQRPEEEASTDGDYCP